MAHIYIALVDTPGFFASLIRHYLGQKYVHVVLSLDEQLSEAYSFGRRNPYIPLIAGFERQFAAENPVSSSKGRPMKTSCATMCDFTHCCAKIS